MKNICLIHESDEECRLINCNLVAGIFTKEETSYKKNCAVGFIKLWERRTTGICSSTCTKGSHNLLCKDGYGP